MFAPFVMVVALGALVGGGGFAGGAPKPAPQPRPPAPPPAPSVPVPSTPAPKPPSGGVFGGSSPFDRKLRADKDRLREAREGDQALEIVDLPEVDGRLGDRLELDLALGVAGTWTFEAVAGTTIRLVARIDGGRGSARLKVDAPSGDDEDVIVLPGRGVRLDGIVAATTGLFRVQLLPQPGDATGVVIVTTSGKPPIVAPRALKLEEGRPTEIPVEGMTGRVLRVLTWRVPRTELPPRPFVDLSAPDGTTTRLEATIVDGDPTRIVLTDVQVDALGTWKLRLADLSRETRTGPLKLEFTEPAPGRRLVRFE